MKTIIVVLSNGEDINNVTVEDISVEQTSYIFEKKWCFVYRGIWYCRNIQE
jgi:hypothetical protein